MTLRLELFPLCCGRHGGALGVGDGAIDVKRRMVIAGR